MAEEEPIGVSNGEPPPEATRVLMEMMETIKRQNEERAEEFRRGQEETRVRMKEVLRGQEQLQRRSEELQRQLEDRRTRRWELEEVEPDFQPFSEEILNEPFPTSYVFPKISLFTGKQDLNAHIKNFRAQMLIHRGSNVFQCKMLAGSLVGTALDWFSTFLEGSVTSLEVFVRFSLILRQIKQKLQARQICLR